jgi:hypothetical protein
MSRLLSPAPWTSQPQQAVGIDWSNPITRGLEFAYLPGLLSDSARKIPNLAVIGSGVSTRSASLVSAANTSSSGLRINSGKILGGLSNSTVLGVAETNLPTGTGNNFIENNARVIYCERSNAGNCIYKLGIGNYTGLKFEFTYRNAGGTLLQQRLSDTTLNDGRPKVYVATKNGTTHETYVGGIGSSGTIGSADTTFTDSGIEARVGSDKGDVNGNWGGLVHLVCGWSRTLSASEIKSLSQNPWQIFAPVRRQLFVASAGGGVTITTNLGTADATGLTASVSASSPTTITASLGTATASGLAATLTQATTITASLGTASASGYQATVAQAASISASLGTATASGYQASVTAAGAVVISANLGTATASGLQANINGSTTISASLGAATAAGYTAALEVAYTLAANLGTASATGKTATVYANETLAATIGQAIAQGYSATITNASPTIGRPTSDISAGAWTPSTGTTLYPMLDEVTPDDLDYISTSSLGATCKLGLNATQYPGSASQQLSVRASSSTGNNLRVVLKDGLTTVKTQDLTLTPTLTTYPLSLTAGEILNISTGVLTIEMTSI